MASEPQIKPFRVLTVGDGDLTLSLALLRAFGGNHSGNNNPNGLQLTATTLLPNYEALEQTYPSTATLTVQELETYPNCTIIYHVDATQLHCHHVVSQQKWDAILFHHPHLGIFATEQEQARQHERLLAHYLWSASQCVVASQGIVHLCLLTTQARTWGLERTCQRLGLHMAVPESTQRPFHESVLEQPDWIVATPPSLSSSRRQRHDKHVNHNHWLVKYGYQHQRTWGVLEPKSSVRVNLEGSRGFKIRKQTGGASLEQKIQELPPQDNVHCCEICLASFLNPQELQNHWEQPVHVPQVVVEHDDKPLQLEAITLDSQCNADSLSTALSEPPNRVRLRKYVQAQFRTTKSQAKSLISQGHVLVNQEIITDDARFVNPDAIVTLNSEHVETSNDTPSNSHLPSHLASTSLGPDISILEEWSLQLQDSNCNAVLVWKPVGMRTIGQFAPSTLEYKVTQQQRPSPNDVAASRYHSWTRLDTGCSGLCLLALQKAMPPAGLQIQHSFVVLVHGHVPDSWSNGHRLLLPLHCVQQWKRRKRVKPNDVHNSLDETGEELEKHVLSFNEVGAQEETLKQSKRITRDGSTDGSNDSNGAFTEIIEARAVLLEKTGSDPISNDNIPALSTLLVEMNQTESGIASLLSYVLRQTYSFRVVGDRFSRQEDAQLLPRSMRNRLKQKLRMACVRIKVDNVQLSTQMQVEKRPRFDKKQPIPDKWRALFWQEFLSKGGEAETKKDTTGSEL